MSQAARVTSLEALEEFKAQLARFGVEAGNALASIDLQIRRAFEWLDTQLKFWQREVRVRQEGVGRAKAELFRRKSMGVDGRGPGYTEQEMALDEALRQLDEAETKVKNCKRWAVVLPQEVAECEGPARVLTGMLEVDLRQAVALLEQKILALEAYVALAAPETNPASRGGQPPVEEESTGG